jgi:lipopolysaccharide/colanic/teichoic acid biosynthesis glycosyltransferase
VSAARGGARAWEWAQRALAAVLLLPAAVVVVPVGLLVRLGSRGPLLVRLVREGKDGAHFRIYKLRTMVPDGEARLQEHLARDAALREEWARYGRLARDPRIAGGVARFARRFSIDELPQLLNVLRGEMNLVGPRPLPLDVVATMPADDRRRRQAVLPGITGLWQISGRSDLSIDEMGRLDRIYLSDAGVWRDLGILLRTAWAVIRANGAY